MKKVLALVLCVLMLSSCFVFSTNAAVSADYDWRKVIADAGYGTVVPTMVETAPVIDGVVNPGEYTKSHTLTPAEVHVSNSSITETNLNTYIEDLTMSYAHDLKYVYIAMQLKTKTGQGQWDSQRFQLQLGVRNKAQGLAQDVWGNRRDLNNRFEFNNYGQDPIIEGYDAEGNVLTRYNGGTNTNSLFHYGPVFTYGEDGDVFVRAKFSNNNLTRTHEYKLSKDYLKRLNLEINPTATDEADDEFIAIQWLVNTQYGLLSYKTTEEMRSAAVAAGDASCEWFAYPVYFCDYDFREVAANNNAAIFAGAAREPDNVPVLDGVISDGEYSTSVTYTATSAPAWINNETFASADIKNFTLHAAHDGKNVYLAFEVEKNTMPGRLDLYDRLNIQYAAFDKPNNYADTNYGPARQTFLGSFPQYEGRASNLTPATNACVDAYFKAYYSTDGGATANGTPLSVYEYKFDLDVLSTTLTAPQVAAGYPTDKAPSGAMTEEDLTYRDTFFFMINYQYANTYKNPGAWTDPDGDWALQFKPSNCPAIANAMKAVGDTSSGWSLLPVLLMDNNAPATNETASVRISYTNAGIRFKTRIAEWDIQEFVNKYGYDNVKVGTLIAPENTLNGAKLTHAWGKADQDYLDVPADVANPYSKTNCVYTYAGSIANIKEENLARNFVAVGYIAYTTDGGTTWNYTYSASSCTRNVSEIATAALADETAGYLPSHKIILSNLIAK